ncbi:PAS domain S-box protein [Azohydromonas lata]|uniref:histidine kinase n=1 Tax=Azohydromonas lata TaxID=45677 RepID=A0ABU5ICB5_9BURK|nr:PAS domain S-box protein [Azohydromonas lata]MDZ5456731.1 PAS domain S-box protein [Azohydromonas lata]
MTQGPVGQAGSAASDGEERFRAMAELLPSMVFETDETGANTWASMAWVRFTGLSREQLAGEGWRAAIHPDDLATSHAGWPLSVATGAEFLARSRVRRHDGAWRWHLVRAVPRRDAAGHVLAWTGSATDIDDLVHGQAALEEQERRSRFLLALNERLRDLTDPQAIVDAASAALGTHLGVAQVGYAEVEQTPSHTVVRVHRDWNDGRLTSVVGEWRLEDFGEFVAAAMKAGRSISVADVRQDARTNAPEVLAAYEAIRTYACLSVPLLKHGRLVATLFVNHCQARPWQDVEIELVQQLCERVWAAVERARAERALAASEAHLQAVLDALPVGVGLADAEGRLVRHNAANRALWGMLPATHHREEYGQWEAYWGDSGERIAARDWALARALRQGQVVRGDLVEYQPVGGGPRRWCLNSAAPVRDAQGRIVGGVAVTLDVTPLRAAQAALAERERILSLFVENAPAAIAMFDTGMRYLAVSRRFLCDYGLPPDTPVIGSSHYEVWQGQPAHWPALHARALQGENVVQERDAFVGADGRQGWLRWSMCPWRDGQGRIAGVLLTAEVITAQVQAEQQLHSSEAQARQAAAQLAQTQLRLEAALASGRLGVWDWNMVTGESWWTPQMFELVGLPVREDGAARADLFMAMLHPEDRSGVERAVGQALDGTHPFDTEMRLVRADGATCWVLGRAVVLRDEQGRAQRMVGVNLDITAQKVAQLRVQELNATLEQQVLQRTDELQLAAGRERAILASAASAIVATDLAGRVTSFNPAAQAMFQRSAEAVLGTPVVDLYDAQYLHSHLADFPPEVLQVLWPDDAARLQGSPGAERSEWIYVRADGTRFPGLLSVSVLRDAYGAPLGLLGVVTDLSERKALEEALRQRTQQAEAANRAKSAFVANMSHEIRTPMNAILGLTHLLAGEGATAQQAAQLARIEGAARHLLSIINDILDLSRIEAGKLELEQRDFSLPALLEQVRSMIGASAAAKALAVEVDMGDVPAWLLGDDTRVRQALLNYAGNAVKFTESGSITLRSRLEQQRDAKLLVRFEVEDTGVGVNPQEVARLFEAFEQADASTTREHGGTGLGLAITRRLAELMGGSAGARPRPGGGSVFWFTAWLGRGAGAPTAEAAPARPDVALRQRHAGARVLVAEDHPVNREVALALLRNVGLDVDFAEHGQAAVEKAVRGCYDLVLMDMQMPVMDGLQATRALRAMTSLQALPILAMTANAFGEDRQACLAAGMDDFVTKPVEPQVLYATLLKWLESGRGDTARQVHPAPQPPPGSDWHSA